MVLNVFAIYDEKAEVYANPFYFVFKGEAIRMFSDVCLDPKSRINMHLEDYSLYRLGSFDDRSGKLTTLNAPEFVIKAVDFKQLKKEDPNDNYKKI